MQVINAAAVSAIVLAGYASAQATLTVNTPGSLFSCQNGQLSWSGGVAPYFPRINAPGSTTQTLEQLPQQSGTTYTWNVNLPAGTTFTFAVADSTGATGYSAVSPAVGANASGDTSCLSASSSSALAGGSSTSAAASGSSSSAAATSSASRAASSTSAASGSSSRAASSTSSSAPAATSSRAADSASNMRGFAAVVAGSVGVVVAALL